MPIYYQCDIKATSKPETNKKAGQKFYLLTCPN